MSNVDLEAVTVRRRALEHELAQVEQRHAELLAEDQELEITARVLARLSGYDRQSVEITPVEDVAPPPSLENATRALRGLVSGGLEQGRSALAKIRATVERRP